MSVVSCSQVDASTEVCSENFGIRLRLRVGLHLEYYIIWSPSFRDMSKLGFWVVRISITHKLMHLKCVLENWKLCPFVLETAENEGYMLQKEGWCVDVAFWELTLSSVLICMLLQQKAKTWGRLV